MRQGAEREGHAAYMRVREQAPQRATGHGELDRTYVVVYRRVSRVALFYMIARREKPKGFPLRAENCWGPAFHGYF
jgi:hypothetical protein